VDAPPYAPRETGIGFRLAGIAGKKSLGETGIGLLFGAQRCGNQHNHCREETERNCPQRLHFVAHFNRFGGYTL
jgi:hypothetical protein